MRYPAHLRFKLERAESRAVISVGSSLPAVGFKNKSYPGCECLRIWPVEPNSALAVREQLRKLMATGQRYYVCSCDGRVV